MKYRLMGISVLGVGLLTGCNTGIRDIDFVSKQFAATYNVDSTKGIDSTNLGSLMDSEAIYSFSEKGKGTNRTQMGMLSKDTPFTWRVSGDSLFIDNKAYTVEKQDKGFIIRSDSVKMILSSQP